jgi:antitoxin YefM
MLQEIKFSDARKHLTSVIDNVQSNLPTIIKRRKSSEKDSLVISKEMVIELIPNKFEIKKFIETDSSITLALENLGVAVNAPTEEEAINQMVNDVIEYAEDYLDNRIFYYNSPNRKTHFPLILNILLCDSKEQVRELLQFAQV